MDEDKRHYQELCSDFEIYFELLENSVLQSSLGVDEDLMQAILTAAEQAQQYISLSDLIVKLFYKLYEPLNYTGRWGDIIYYWPRIAVPAAKTSSDPARAARLMIHYGIVENNRGQAARAENIYREAQDILKSYGDPKSLEELADLLFQRGTALARRGDYKEARDVLLECVKTCDDSRRQDTKGFALIQLGNLEVGYGRYNRSFTYYQESLDIWNLLKEDQGLAHTALHAFGEALRLSGRYDEALEKLESSLKIKKARNEIEGIARTSYAIGMILIAKCQFQEAQKYLENSLNLGKQLEDFRSIYSAKVGLGYLENAKGNYSDAREYLLDAFEVAGERLVPIVTVQANILMIKLSLKTGNFQDIGLSIGKLVKILRSHKMPLSSSLHHIWGGIKNI